MHVAALNDSKASLDILASFVTEELFDLRNKDGMMALDVATSLKNVEFVRALEAVRRNLTVSNALSERDMMYPKARTQRRLTYNGSSEDSEDEKLGPDAHYKADMIAKTERMMASRGPEIAVSRPSLRQLHN